MPKHLDYIDWLERQKLRAMPQEMRITIDPEAFAKGKCGILRREREGVTDARLCFHDKEDAEDYKTNRFNWPFMFRVVNVVNYYNFKEDREESVSV